METSLIFDLCPNCGKEKKKSIKACSKTCRTKLSWENRERPKSCKIKINNCLVCNNYFQMYRDNIQTIRKTCSRKCGAILMRQRLKSDPEKYAKFVSKVVKNQAEIWNKRTDEESAIIHKKVAIKHRAITASLTREERQKKYTFNIDGNTEQCMKNLKSGKMGYKSNMKGRFKLAHPEKYLGNPTNVIYRSSYELKVFMQLDHDPNIIGWSSEEVVIPYISPLDKRPHRYFPDLKVKENINGKTITKIIEIKPYCQTLKPIPPSIKSKAPSKNKRFIKEAQTYVVNQAKWASAREFCKNRGFEFVVLTEKEIFGK